MKVRVITPFLYRDKLTRKTSIITVHPSEIDYLLAAGFIEKIPSKVEVVAKKSAKPSQVKRKTIPAKPLPSTNEEVNHD